MGLYTLPSCQDMFDFGFVKTENCFDLLKFVTNFILGQYTLGSHEAESINVVTEKFWTILKNGF